jgi:hypothetical protein
MRDTSREIKTIRGVLFPYYFNSDGRAIHFLIQTPAGEIYFLRADHLTRKLRKMNYQNVIALGVLKSTSQDDKHLHVKKIYIDFDNYENHSPDILDYKQTA